MNKSNKPIELLLKLILPFWTERKEFKNPLSKYNSFASERFA